jgi:hypothetical protein
MCSETYLWARRMGTPRPLMLLLLVVLAVSATAGCCCLCAPGCTYTSCLPHTYLMGCVPLHRHTLPSASGGAMLRSTTTPAAAPPAAAALPPCIPSTTWAGHQHPSLSTSTWAPTRSSLCRCCCWCWPRCCCGEAKGLVPESSPAAAAAAVLLLLLAATSTVLGA